MCPSFLLPWGRFNFSSSACTNRLYKQVLQCAFAHSWNLLWSSRFEYYLNMNYGERAFQRTVVLLEKRRNAVPVNAEMSRFVNARRVMNTVFTKNHTASPIGDVLCNTFPWKIPEWMRRSLVTLVTRLSHHVKFLFNWWCLPIIVLKCSYKCRDTCGRLTRLFFSWPGTRLF